MNGRDVYERIEDGGGRGGFKRTETRVNACKGRWCLIFLNVFLNI